MSAKFPTQAPVYTTQKLSKTRVAIFEDGEYVCQLQPKEVASWLYKAEQSAARFVDDKAYESVNRIIAALEYLAARKMRASAVFAANQMELF